MNSIKILFIIDRAKANKLGLAPIRCRITYIGKRKPFATGLFIKPKFWNSVKQKTLPETIENTQINTQLSLIKQEINQAFLLLQIQGRDFTVEDIYSQYKGELTAENYTIIEMFNLHISKQEKLIGISTSVVSVAKFFQTKTHVKSFIKYKFNRSDYLLKDMTMAFITEFEYYLKAEKRFQQNTIHKTLQRFKQIVKLAVGLDYLAKDPFQLHVNRRPKKQVIFLSIEELKTIENYTFASSRLEKVKDMFIFCCYTGLAFSEMSNLEPKHIEVGFDGLEWIKMTRKKTDKEIAIPILSKAKEIIEKYRTTEGSLPKISNQRFNAYLKEIAEILDIEKNLTHHVARKTFATTVLLYNDVPMEIVSELLGHSEMSITQAHYGKIIKAKVSEQMINLGKKLDKNS